ncbi:hypothetical protein DFR70_12329 [Nocardia tenerifensis]|uniref:Uncharacterized protein n=1 Tax=Nocardia tenerifensis TaxID=228006 RepID=A0A318JN36_9NOCA|nr:hypothetical protein DFR70_12329 [Nocardia tenerifensis]
MVAHILISALRLAAPEPVRTDGPDASAVERAPSAGETVGHDARVERTVVDRRATPAAPPPGESLHTVRQVE